MFFLILQDTVRAALPSPGDLGVEETVRNIVLWFKLAAELTGVLIIGMGVAVTIVRVSLSLGKKRETAYDNTRLNLAKYLALGLELQLAADIMATAVAPSWTQVGKLGAIAAIRTGLNYFLAREVKEERQQVAEDAPTPCEN